MKGKNKMWLWRTEFAVMEFQNYSTALTVYNELQLICDYSE
jgi:hypothetical protein